MLKPDTALAVRFLRDLGAPRVLVAIQSDANKIVAGTPDTSEKVRAWIERHNATCGTYFTANRTKRPMTKKPEKADMAWMDYAHAELDPPKAIRATPEWREHVRTNLNALSYPPTFVWDSGNGVQALWRLEPPIRLTDAEAIARCEAVNRGLLDALRSETVEVQGTHNIERLLRIPGTVNYPNKLKRAAGRKVTMAGNVEYHPEHVYELDDLPSADVSIADDESDRTIGEPVITKDLSRLKTSDRCKAIVRDGRIHGERKERDDSRSAWEWEAICTMVRDGIPDETILGLLTDPRWAISERVLENRSEERAEKYARKEIARAHKEIRKSLSAEFEGEPLPDGDDDWLERGLPEQTEEPSEYTADAFDGEESPEQGWIVENMIPADDVTLNMGDGGAGKTTIMLQLLVAKTVGKAWLGLDTGEAARTAFFSGEERRPVIHRRLNDIINGAASPYQGDDRVTWKDLRGLKIFGLSDRDALLALPDRRTGRIKPTALYDWIDRGLGEWKPTLVVFDALYDIYGGDENAKAQVRQFVFLMRKLTHKHGCAIVVTGHPSLFGMQSGMGTSGSTAWSNAFRSRLYTTKEKSKRGVETHKVAAMKLNYGKPDTAVEAYWENGIFVPVFEDEDARFAEAQQTKAKFLDLLAAYTKEGRKVSPVVGTNFAPTIFARDNRSDGIDMREFRNAMNELFAERRIVCETVGSGSHASSRIVLSG